MHLIAGTLLFIYAWIKHREQLKIDWLSIAKFVAFMLFVTAIRWGIMDITNAPYHQPQVAFWNFLLVFTEDMAYGFPIYLAKDVLKLRKWVWVSLAIALSVHFASGHFYQGVFAGCVSAVYPFFISYRYARKTSFGTVMVAHLLYDFMTLASVVLFHLCKMMMNPLG
jgi:hypothetical protein